MYTMHQKNGRTFLCPTMHHNSMHALWYVQADSWKQGQQHKKHQYLCVLLCVYIMLV